MSEQTDVVIIGGGFSGIAAAKKLHESKIPFLLLEARDRLGGRTFTEFYNDNSYLELGGQWIGPTQDRMYELAEEHNVSWFETYNQGINQLDLNKKLRKYRGLIPKMDPASLGNIDWLIRKMERMARKIPVSNPWLAKKAKKLDRITLEEFIEKNSLTSSAKKVLRAGLETVYACELNEISLLHALFYIRSGTSLDNLLSIENGAQQHRIKGGMQPFAEKIALPFKDSIRFNSPVIHIDWDDHEVVISGEAFSIIAKKAILAIPPVLSNKIHFNPKLPIYKSQLLDKLSMGIVGKVFGIYEKPFWREKGFSGQVVSDDHYPFQTLFDVSPEDGSQGILLAFCIAERARDFFSKTASERESLTKETFARYFGDEAKAMTRYRDHCWAEEVWSRGCYAGLYPTGAWTGFRDTLAKPSGSLHWAGTETSDKWYGYIEGAVRAGERAATEIQNSFDT